MVPERSNKSRKTPGQLSLKEGTRHDNGKKWSRGEKIQIATFVVPACATVLVGIIAAIAALLPHYIDQSRLAKEPAAKPVQSTGTQSPTPTSNTLDSHRSVLGLSTDAAKDGKSTRKYSLGSSSKFSLSLTELRERARVLEAPLNSALASCDKHRAYLVQCKHLSPSLQPDIEESIQALKVAVPTIQANLSAGNLKGADGKIADAERLIRFLQTQCFEAPPCNN